MDLRLNEELELTVNEIDSVSMTVNISDGKRGKDRLLPLPHRTLIALRYYWKTHKHPLLFVERSRFATEKQTAFILSFMHHSRCA